MIYFSDNEFQDVSKLDTTLKANLDNFRHELSTPITITADYSTTGHSPSSMHYVGKAVDGYLECSVYDFIRLALKYFKAFGVYIDVASGKIRYFHVDVRPSAPQVWIGLLKPNLPIQYIYTMG